MSSLFVGSTLPDAQGNLPIGSGHTSGVGGYIEIQPSAEAATHYVDVGQWSIEIQPALVDLPISGGLGHSDGRRVCMRGGFSCELIYDIRNPALLYLRPEYDLALTFYLGDPAFYPSNDGIPTIDQRYWWCPRVSLARGRALLDASGKRLVRESASGNFLAHVLLCPDQGTPENLQSIAGAYKKYITGAGDE